MAASDAQALVDRLNSDEQFAQSLRDASPDERRTIIKDAGFNVSEEDVAALRSQSASGDVSDAELEQVAGGQGTTTSIIVDVAVVAASG